MNFDGPFRAVKEPMQPTVAPDSFLPNNKMSCEFLTNARPGPLRSLRLMTLGGKPLDLIIYIIIIRACAALRPHKYMNGPLGLLKVMCSLWLH